ncbi:MAG TPA: SGNH/GDSL hydrolase family protein [Opitutaceae bacterium]|nr:SGNH/GDSL hydrolase family protein [Opitutaceae bacterium]
MGRKTRSTTGRLARKATLVFLFGVLCVCGSSRLAAQISTFCWFDLSAYGVEGKGWSETKSYYDRLPAKAEGVVREKVWELSHDSSGMCFRFVTDAEQIGARWVLTKAQLALVHMPSTGVSGLDLYVREGSAWRWLGFGRAQRVGENLKLLTNGRLNPGRREYLLYLPLYNGVSKVEIGVPPGAAFAQAEPYPSTVKPLVFYGTSITQGGVASRPGMAYPAILGRKLARPVINLGFSGNGQAEPEMASLLAELDPAVFVLDALPNLSSKQVTERMPHLIRTLRTARPRTPLVLVENIVYVDGPYVEEGRGRRSRESNTALAAIYHDLLANGEKEIYYVRADQLLGEDGEDTVDGTHPTDLGFSRIAAGMEPVLREALKMNSR